MALSTFEAWEYFGTVEATALTALRDRMGTTYASSPTDAKLLLILQRAVKFVHKGTRRFFLKRTGTLALSGQGDARLHVPHPIVSTDQGGNSITEIILGSDTDAVDSDAYVVNDGAVEGGGPEDPRENPFIEWSLGWDGAGTSKPPLIAYPNRYWPYGVQNVAVTGDFGYLEEDGSTPEPILHVLARICVLNADPLDDSCAMEDRRKGALVSETVQGRSYSVLPQSVSLGLTMDREIDQILRGYRAPPMAIVSRAPRRRSRSRYFVE